MYYIKNTRKRNKDLKYRGLNYLSYTTSSKESIKDWKQNNTVAETERIQIRHD